ncbi:unnamed protein product, partial [Laminaria digitata]
VYAGSVSPSVSLTAWEGMGLEERLAAILRASSSVTIAADVRAFARASGLYPWCEDDNASPTGGGGRGSQGAAAAAPRHLEGVLVRVLGALIK